MVKFLNDFMVNRHLDELSRNKLRQMFVSTVDTILKCLGEDAFKPKRALVAAVLDSIMVGIARRLERAKLMIAHL